jgi:hypothetical protein
VVGAVVGVVREDPQPEQPPESKAPLPRSATLRVVVAGAFFAGAPWLLQVAVPGLFWFLIVPTYFLTSAVVPFIVSVWDPMGNRVGARLGLRIVLVGLVWFVVFIGIMSAYKLELYLGRPFFTLLITALFLPVLIPLAMFAGSVGGYVPEDGAVLENPGGPPVPRE